MIVAVTGHRPPKIGGYDPANPIRVRVRAWLRDELAILRPERAISGMALGVDQDFAEIAVEMNIPFVAAVPFHGQEAVWPALARARYHRLMKAAAEQVVVSSGGYSARAMQVRNEWAVDRCALLLAVWDGSEGGTANCVRYARRVGREVKIFDPKGRSSMIQFHDGDNILISMAPRQLRRRRG